MGEHLAHRREVGHASGTSSQHVPKTPTSHLDRVFSGSRLHHLFTKQCLGEVPADNDPFSAPGGAGPAPERPTTAAIPAMGGVHGDDAPVDFIPGFPINAEDRPDTDAIEPGHEKRLD